MPIFIKKRQIKNYPKWHHVGTRWDTYYEGKHYSLVQYDSCANLYNLTDRHFIGEDQRNGKYIRRNLPQFLMESLL